MKKLLINTDESVLCSCFKTGVGEMADSLAVSLAGDYRVTLTAPPGKNPLIEKAGTDGLFMGVKFIMTESPEREADRIKPDILHNLGDPELLGRLRERPPKTVYTIDNINAVRDKLPRVMEYDAVTTVSESYAREIKGEVPEVKGVLNGILTEVINPEKGILLPAAYTPEDQRGKALCKRRLLNELGVKGDPCLYVFAGRPAEEKGIEEIKKCLGSVPGLLLFAIPGKLKAGSTGGLPADYVRSVENVRVLPNTTPFKAAVITAAADFLLYPSRYEPCGLMPMTACRYGTIPVTTLAGGLRDNMTPETAVIIPEGDDPAAALKEAILESEGLYRDKPRFYAMRERCMRADFGWNTRKKGYISVYEE